MPDTLETIKDYLIEDAEWHQVNSIFPDSPTAALTVKNLSGKTVSIFITEDETLTPAKIDAYLTANAINPPEVGGVTYEISSNPSSRVFVKAPGGSATLSIRIFGTVDPTADITELAKVLGEQVILLDGHIKTVSGNPHKVTKGEVGLGNIPNALVHDVDDANYPENPTGTQKQSTAALVSLKALRLVRDFIKAHIKTVSGNPHKVTKSEVGLGKVANYAVATDAEAIDHNNNAAYLTPKSGAILVKDMVQIAASVKPQTIVSGQIASRLPGWSMYDITVPSNIIVQNGNRGFVINAGLVVAFAYRGKVIISNMTEQDIIGSFEASMPDAIYYIYVNLDSKGNIQNYGITHSCPTSGTYKEATQGDFFNTATCTMLTSEGNEVQRVYVGKAYFSSNKITQLIGVPFGDTAIIPVISTIPQGKSVLVANPFIDKVSATAFAEYGGKWAETRWNDQTGIIASPKPNDEYNNIIVQSGQVGYLTSGASSGSGFGESFVTITVAPRVTLKLKKEY